MFWCFLNDFWVSDEFPRVCLSLLWAYSESGMNVLNSTEFNGIQAKSFEHMQLDAFKTSVEPVSTGCCKFGMGFVILWIILEFQYSLEFCGLQFKTIGSQTISELFFTVLQPYYSHPRVWSVRNVFDFCRFSCDSPYPFTFAASSKKTKGSLSVCPSFSSKFQVQI